MVPIESVADAPATIASVAVIHRIGPPPTKKRIVSDVPTNSPTIATGRRPRVSASRPASRIPISPGMPLGDAAEERDAGAREVVDVREVAVRELRRRCAEDVGEEPDAGEEQEPLAVLAVEHLSKAAPFLGAGREVGVSAGLVEPAGEHRQQHDREPADRERDAPRVAAEVREREQDHRKCEPRAAREREHRERERTRAFRCLFDDRDAADDDRRVGAGAQDGLCERERLDRRRDGRGGVREADARDRVEEDPSSSDPVGECGGDEREERAAAGDGQRLPEPVVRDVERLRDAVGVLAEERGRRTTRAVPRTRPSR